MKRLAICGLASAVAIACLGLSMPASATSQTIDLGQVFTGTTPTGPAPWLIATFTYTPGSNQGTLVLGSHLGSGGFLQGGGVAGWAFYLSGNTLSVNSCSGACAASVSSSPGSGPVKGTFNLGFNWGSGSRFDGSDMATYSLTFGSALGSVSPFAANTDGWFSFAHVQGLNVPGCAESGFIVSGTGAVKSDEICGSATPPPVSVPEPAGLGILGLGTLMLGVFVGLRRRWS